MHIVFFNHPSFLGSQSMPRFAALLFKGMKQRGHEVEIWTPDAFFYKLPVTRSIKKWMGYIDQYILFPAQIKKRLKKCPADTLFVFTDHALGPWVPLVANRPHVIHCHDFLAQRSALRQIAENQVSFTGKKYQKYINKGYKQGKNFISVSKKTQADLHQILGCHPPLSEMVYNGLNQEFKLLDDTPDKSFFKKEDNIDLSQGYILHIGGNQWYKNRLGVIEIYNAWRNKFGKMLPLVMLGVAPNAKVLEEYNTSPYKNEIHIMSGKNDAYIRSAYACATAFLFPSLAEGFGWPIAEAMASGCPVITTNEAPMTEVAGDAAFFINKRPSKQSDVKAWADNCADCVNEVLTLSSAKRKLIVDSGIENAKRFNTNVMLDNIERIYTDLVKI